MGRLGRRRRGSTWWSRFERDGVVPGQRDTGSRGVSRLRQLNETTDTVDALRKQPSDDELEAEPHAKGGRNRPALPKVLVEHDP